MFLKNKIGFTLVELLVVIFIIVLIGTLVTVSFLNIKRGSRDAKRITDITEIQTALENYKFFEGSYPETLTPGESLVGHNTGNTYLTMVPENPSYQSYDCSYDSYTYFYDTDNEKYKISFCLEGKVDNYDTGPKCAISEGIVDGNCVPLTILAGNPVNGQVGEAYIGHTFSAISGTEPYVFSVASGSSLPGGLSLSSTGSLTGNPTSNDSYSFFIEVTDAESATSSREFSMTIDPAVLALGSSNPVDAEAGIAYAGYTFMASGGVGPYTFSLLSGTLPSGLNLSSTGDLTGTPTVSGSYDFAIEVSDSLLATSSRDFTMLVLFGCGENITFTYKGSPVTYGTVQNSVTGECWLDRNLGATQVAISSADADAYGDLFQWGRAADGHQVRTSATTATLATSNTPGHSNFIVSAVSPFDWRNPQNTNLWQGVSGVNNPCPSGWRIPTAVEWDSEKLSWATDNAAGAFASVLKLTASGSRNNQFASIGGVSTHGVYWTSSSSGPASSCLVFYSSGSMFNNYYRASGLTVRCIRD